MAAAILTATVSRRDMAAVGIPAVLIVACTPNPGGLNVTRVTVDYEFCYRSGSQYISVRSDSIVVCQGF